MAFIYITEYVNAPPIQNGQMLAVGAEPAIAEQRVAIGGASASSAAFNAKTKFVRIHTDAICSIKFGASGSTTAVATEKRMAANTTEFFGVVPGQVVANITNT